MSKNIDTQQLNSKSNTRHSSSHQFQAASEIVQEVSEIHNLDALLAKVVDLAANRFGYLHIYLYLLEDDKLIFQDGVDELGNRLKELSYHVGLSSQSLLAKAARHGQSILVPDITQLQDQLPNILFADTKSELVIPLKLGSKVLGVLDLHGTSVDEFNDDDEALLNGFCGLISVFVANCRAETSRNQVTEALQQSEAKYRSILASIEDGYYEVDLAGNLNFFNDSLCHVLGYPADQLMGMNNRDYADEENAQKVYEKFNQVYQTGKPIKDFSWQVIHQDGTKGYVETSVSLVKNDVGEAVGFCGVVRDITVRRQNAERLAQSFSLVQATFEATADGILVVDREGNVTNFNPRFIEIWQIPDGLIETKNSASLIEFVLNQLQDPDQFMAKVQELYDQPEAESFDILFFKTGQILERYSYPQRVGDEYYGRIWSFRDITERSSIEKMLEIRTKAMDASHEPISIADALQPDMPLIYVNPAFERVTGYSAAEVLGKNCRFLQGDDRDQTGLVELRAALQAGHNCVVTLRNYRKDGTLFWNELHISAVRDAQGTVTHFLGGQKDITESQELAASLIRSENELLQLLEWSPEAIGVINTKTGLFENPNANSEQLYGLSRDELVQVGPADMSSEYQPDGRLSSEKAAEKIQEALNRGAPVFEWTHLNAQGREIPCEVRLLGLPGAQSHLIRFSVTDITERTMAQEALAQSLAETEERARQLNALNELASQLNQLEAREDLFNVVVTKSAKIVNCDRVSIAMLDENGLEFDVYALDYLQAGPLLTSRATTVDTLLGLAVTEKRAIIELTPESSTAVDAQQFSKQGIRSLMVVPLLLMDGVIGTLNIGSGQHNAFGTREQQLMQQIASMLAYALENRQLLKQTQAALAETEQLYQTSFSLNTAQEYSDILQSLVAAIDQIDLKEAFLYLIDIDETGRPEWLQVVATWQSATTKSTFPVGHRFYLPEFLMSHMWINSPDEALIVEHVSQDARMDDNFKAVFQQLQAQATIIVPLRLGSNWIGLANFNWHTPQSFSDRLIKRLSTFSTQSALVLNNRLLLQQAQRRASREQTIRQITEKMRAAPNIDLLLETTARELGAELGVQRARLKLGIDLGAEAHLNHEN